MARSQATRYRLRAAPAGMFPAWRPVLVSIALWAPSLCAADPPGVADTAVIAMPEMVVTATRSPRARDLLPGVVRVVARSELLRDLPRTPTDAVASVPGVMGQKTSPGQGSPYLRGFTGFRTLHLLDGVRLNNSVYREGPNQYWGLLDAFGLEGIEVLLGPASVAYGSDGVGGVLHAITPRPASTGPRGSLVYRAASAEESQIGHLEAVLPVPLEGAVRIGATLRQLGQLQAGRGTGAQAYTDYHDGGFDVRAELPISRRRLILSYQSYFQDDVPRTHATVFARSFAGTSVGTDLRRQLDHRRQLAYVQWRPERRRQVDEFEVGLSYQRLSEDEDRIRGDGAVRLQGLDVSTLGGFLQTQMESRTGLWTAGIEHYHDEVDSYANSSPIQGPVGDDARYDVGAAFLMNEQRLPSGWTILSGARFTRASAQAERVRDPRSGAPIAIADRWHNLVGNVRLGWLPPSAAVGAYVGVSQAFRAPNLSDLSRFDLARTAEIEVPAPDLDPERFVSAEAGVRMRWSSLRGEMTAYRTWIRELIVRRPTGRVVDGNVEVTRANAAGGFIQGFESQIEWRASARFWSRGQVAWQRGEADQYPSAEPVAVREPFSRLIPATGRLSMGWVARQGLEIEGGVTTAERQDRLSTDDRRDTSRIPPGGTPGYAVLYLRAVVRPHPAIAMSVAVENLTNEDYRIHGSGSNEPGRNFVTGVIAQF